MRSEHSSREGSTSTTPASTPAATLSKYWQETRLRHAEARSISHRPGFGTPLPWRDALEQILTVGYGSRPELRHEQGAWRRTPRRTVPSAGAIYPYDIFAVLADGAYRWNIETGRLEAWQAPGGLLEHAAALGIVAPGQPAPAALLVFAARPWQAMQKYYRRGYGYTHLDVGHAVSNVALYTRALGQRPVLHLRFDHRGLAERLDLSRQCREPLALLTFSAENGADPTPSPAIAPAGPLAQPARTEDVDATELEAWISLRELMSFDADLLPPHDPATGWPLAAPTEALGEELALPATRLLPNHPREWRRAILERRSAKGFLERSMGLDALAAVLDALRFDEVPSDCAADTPAVLGVRVIARRLEGAHGVYSYHPGRHALGRLDELAESPRAACMQQALAENAAAVLVFHAPIRRLVEQHGYSAFSEILFRAGELAQRMHLVAARLPDLGMTCIGGFDGEECARVARLTGVDEPVYVVLLGAPDDSASKHDRLSVAFSHGHTSRMG